MFPLDKAPRGLLELLRLRTGGLQPNGFDPIVGGVLECGGFYGADILTTTTSAPTVGALTNLTEIVTLSNRPAWRLRALGARLTVGAAPITAGGRLEIGLQDLTTNVQVPLGAETFGVGLATAVIGFGIPCDLVLEARWNLYVTANGTAAGADHSLLLAALVEPYLFNS